MTKSLAWGCIFSTRPNAAGWLLLTLATVIGPRALREMTSEIRRDYHVMPGFPFSSAVHGL